MMKPFSLTALCVLIGLFTQGVAAESSKEALRERLTTVFGAPPASITEAPMQGFYEALYGTKIYYVSADGSHLLSGEVFDLNTLSNLTEKRRGDERLKAMATVDESSMIVFRAEKEKHILSVFTDIDCVYCRKLHEGMEEMNKLGITVRYLAYPRTGVNTPSYDKAVNVWCARDRNKAMDEAKRGGNTEKAECDAPVKMHMDLAERLGVTGTPALVLEDGRMQPGYAPPQQLLALFK